MNPNNRLAASLAMLSIAIVASLAAHTVSAQSVVTDQVPEGVYLNLTHDFYEALRKESVTVYSTNKSDAHIKELAISARFLVQTNLAILKQQEEMVRLMRQVLDKK